MVAGAIRRFDELDGYRGIAALLIVVFHAYKNGPVNDFRNPLVGHPLDVLLFSLDVPVAWFFVLSGFVVFLPFARVAIDRAAPIRPGAFLLRRALRILPLYYLVFLVSWLLFGGRSGDAGRDLVLHLTMSHIFDPRHIWATHSPAWSLAVESIYYVWMAAMAPPLCDRCARFASRSARARALYLVIGLAVVGSVAYKGWAMGRYPVEMPTIWYGPVARFDAFGLGMILAIAVVERDGRPWFPSRLLVGVRAVAILALGTAFMARQGNIVVWVFMHTIAGGAFAAICATTILAARDSGWERAFASRPLAALGAVSYGVYLWHEPLLVFLGQGDLFLRAGPGAFPQNAMVLPFLAMALALVTYRLVERPAQRLAVALTRPARRPVSATPVTAPAGD